MAPPNLFEMLGIPTIPNFGAGQNNVAQATSPRSGIQSMASFPGMPDRQAGLEASPAYAGIQSRLGQIEPRQNALLESLNKGPGISKSTAMLNSVASILPMILGLALAKKKGGAIGGQVGMQVGESLNAASTKRAKDDYDQSKFQYDNLKDEKKTLSDQAFQLSKDATTGSADDQAGLFKSGIDFQRDLAKIDYKAAVDPSGTNVNVHVPGNPRDMPGALQTKVAANETTRQRLLQNAEDARKNLPPEILNEALPVNEDGSPNLGQVKELFTRKFGRQFFGGTSLISILGIGADEASLKTLYGATGAAAPTSEELKTFGYTTGSGQLTNAAVPVMLYMMEKHADRLKHENAAYYDQNAKGPFDGKSYLKFTDDQDRERQTRPQIPLPKGLAVQANTGAVTDAAKKVGGKAIGGIKTILDAPPGLDGPGFVRWKRENNL